MVKHDVDRTIKEANRKHTITAIYTHTHTCRLTVIQAKTKYSIWINNKCVGE